MFYLFQIAEVGLNELREQTNLSNPGLCWCKKNPLKWPMMSTSDEKTVQSKWRPFSQTPQLSSV